MSILVLYKKNIYIKTNWWKNVIIAQDYLKTVNSVPHLNNYLSIYTLSHSLII